MGSGTGGGTGGTGAEDVTDVSVVPRMNEPDMIMIVYLLLCWEGRGGRREVGSVPGVPLGDAQVVDVSA